jgi:hypothetical protein
MKIQNTDTAVVFIDPQNDVLSEKGSSWGAVGRPSTLWPMPSLRWRERQPGHP